MFGMVHRQDEYWLFHLEQKKLRFLPEKASDMTV